MSVVLGAGLTPAKDSNTQLLAAIKLLAGGVLAPLLEERGYIELGGLIVQWGATVLPTGSNYVFAPLTFRKPFPTTCWGIYGNADGGANPDYHPVIVTFDGRSTTGATISADSGNAAQSITLNRTVTWLAFGH